MAIENGESGLSVREEINISLAFTQAITATAAELNTLDGITASTSELNILDGVTASTSELNIMDGVTASTAEINQLDNNTFTTEINTPSITVSGTNGAGHTHLRWQASDPGGTGNHTAFFADADGDLAFRKGQNSVLTVATTTDVAGKVTANTAITGATKTKITYDTKGLVTAGADATTADIADSLNKRYVTDAQQTVLSNTSGTNTGDQTSIVGITGTKAQFDTAVTDGNFAYQSDLAAYQPLDSDLTAIAAITPVDNDIIQRKAGAWINRTPAQLKTDLSLTKSDVGLGSVVNADTTTTTNITDSSNKRFITDAQQTVLTNTSGTNTGDQNIFQTIAVSGQSNVVADSTADTLTLVAGTNVTITTNAATDTITIAAPSTGGVEIQTSTATGVQTNLNTSASTSKNVITMLRWTPGSMAILQSLNTTGWEDGKIIRIMNRTSQSGTNGRLILIENQNGATGTQFIYTRNGIPLMLMPGDHADFSFNSTDSLLNFIGGSSFSANPAEAFDLYTDFNIFNTSQPFSTSSATYSVSLFEGDTTKKPFGVSGYSSASSSSYTGGFLTSSRANGLIPAQGCAMTLHRVSLPTALSDGTQTYIFEAGFLDSTGNPQTDGAFWRSNATGSTVWRTVTSKASTETVTDQTGYNISITEYPYLGVFCNSDWTNIQFFYSNDGLTWSIGNVHTANTPAATNLLNIGGSFRKTAGTTSRSAEWDLCGYRYQFRRGI